MTSNIFRRESCKFAFSYFSFSQKVLTNSGVKKFKTTKNLTSSGRVDRRFVPIKYHFLWQKFSKLKLDRQVLSSLNPFTVSSPCSKSSFVRNSEDNFFSVGKNRLIASVRRRKFGSKFDLVG